MSVSTVYCLSKIPTKQQLIRHTQETIPFPHNLVFTQYLQFFSDNMVMILNRFVIHLKGGLCQSKSPLHTKIYVLSRPNSVINNLSALPL